MNDKYMNKRRQLWADLVFATKLDEIKLKCKMNGRNVNTIAELTKMIVECDQFKEIENEILSGKLRKNKELRFRYDGNL